MAGLEQIMRVIEAEAFGEIQSKVGIFRRLGERNIRKIVSTRNNELQQFLKKLYAKRTKKSRSEESNETDEEERKVIVQTVQVRQ